MMNELVAGLRDPGNAVKSLPFLLRPHLKCCHLGHLVSYQVGSISLCLRKPLSSNSLCLLARASQFLGAATPPNQRATS
jgi:hypothetical protein